MLRSLRISNLVLIHEAELDFAAGLNAITGETGAGKTILAQAVGLLLGTKGDASFVGAGGEEAYVEAELDIPEGLDGLDELRPEGEDAMAVARRLRTGQVDVNGGAFNILAPFGGYKQSGNGRELGRFGLEEFLETKSIQQ